MRTLAAFALFALSVAGADAQQTVATEPFVRAKLDPATVVVGQSATLTLDVLVPNYMTKPPVLPAFQIRNVVTHDGSTVNISEQVDGVSFAGVRYEFLLYPQEPGAYVISERSITVTYAAGPPESREAVVRIPSLSFQAVIPDAAQALDPFVSAQRLVVHQEIKPSSDHLKVGDSVVRTVTIEADSTPAMLLPPLPLVRSPGAEAYPAQPEFQDKYDSRTGVLVSRRIDQVTHMLQQAGQFSLPAIDIGWWNVGAGKVETAHLDAMSYDVVANPATQGTISDGARARWNWSAVRNGIAEHWLLAALIAIAFAVIAWFAPVAARSITAAYRQRRKIYLQSEAWSFRRLRRVAGSGDARTVYFAMLDWLQRFEPVASDRTIKAFKAAAADPVLDSEIGSIEQQLFASHRNAGEWSSCRLLWRVGAARRKLRRQAASHGAKRQLPQHINPMGIPESSTESWRKPAR